MLEFLAKGGVLVTPILLCSVLALTIFLERTVRFVVLRKRGRNVRTRSPHVWKDMIPTEPGTRLGAAFRPWAGF